LPANRSDIQQSQFLVTARATLFGAVLLLHFTVGMHTYLHWTVGFAAQRRTPAMADMLGVYIEPSLLWTLPWKASGDGDDLAAWLERAVAQLSALLMTSLFHSSKDRHAEARSSCTL
jgi:hypothetical protein